MRTSTFIGIAKRCGKRPAKHRASDVPAGLVLARLMSIELVDTVHRGASFSNPRWKHGKRQSNVRLERLAGMAQATRQQVRNMHGLIETMKEREYVPGESKITDDRITDTLRGMAEPNGLTDAVIAKIIRPDMGFDEFESIADLEEKASYDVFDTLRAIMLPSGYDVSHAMARAFKQDIPRLFEQFAILIHPASERAGLSHRGHHQLSRRRFHDSLQAFCRYAVPGQARGRDAP